MNTIIDHLFGAASFIPHGYCLLWRPDLVALHAISDSIIALSYFTIPVGIVYFIHHRPDFGYSGIFGCFAAFIVACGLTHLAGLVTLWAPYYGLQGLIKAGTATISLITAYLIWPIIPQALTIMSPATLNAINKELESKIAENSRVTTELRSMHENLEDRVKERTAELVEANGRLTRYSYIASHDLQEPLRKIITFAEILEAAMTTGNSQEADYARQAMKDAAIRARTLVADLLDLSRASHEEVSTTSVSVKETVESVLNDLAEHISKARAEIVINLPEIFVKADKIQFASLLQNLVGNSLKYRDPYRTARIEILGSYDDRSIFVLSIKDNGIGFGPQYTTEIFEPFVRLHKRTDYPGTGIGLSICAAIAKRHGWKLVGKGQVGIGATFTLTIDLENRAGKAIADVETLGLVGT